MTGEPFGSTSVAFDIQMIEPFLCSSIFHELYSYRLASAMGQSRPLVEQLVARRVECRGSGTEKRLFLLISMTA